MSNGAEHTIDAGAAGIVIATFFSWLPHIAALLSIVWFALRIYGELVDRGFVEGKQMKKRESDDS